MAIADIFLPDMQDTNVFRDRSQKNGLYDMVVEQFDDMGTEALANMTFDKDFFADPLNIKSNCSMKYVDKKHEVVTFNLIGEVVGSVYGTRLGPDGNHYRGNKQDEINVIDDESKAKFVITLSEPSFSTQAMKRLFARQVSTIESVIFAQEKLDADQSQPFTIRSVVNEVGGDRHTLTLTNDLPIYFNPNKTSRVSSIRSLGKRPAGTTTPPLVINEPMDDKDLPDEAKVTRESRYSPRTFRNYGGPLFQQRHALVNQPPFYDIDSKLIVPWRLHTKLNPGTLVVVTASMMSWAPKWDDPSRDRKRIYQLLIHELKVEGLSDVEPLPLEIPSISYSSSPARPVVTLKKRSALHALSGRPKTGSSSGVTSEATPARSMPHVAPADSERSPSGTSSLSSVTMSRGSSVTKRSPPPRVGEGEEDGQAVEHLKKKTKKK
ncbi:hypothetical protein PM082_004818 [Marasmius tenuissimus]|nr:hypothetical protein PM082_004818 [Marasmius tenuissimus]